MGVVWACAQVADMAKVASRESLRKGRLDMEAPNG